MIISKISDGKRELTQEEIEMLNALKDRPIVFDEDSPELTEEELKQFKRVSENWQEEHRKNSLERLRRKLKSVPVDDEKEILLKHREEKYGNKGND